MTYKIEETFVTVACPSGDAAVTSTSNGDTLTLAAGSGMTITGNSTTRTVTLASSGGGSSESTVTYTFSASSVTASTAGSITDQLEVPADKTITMITVDVPTGFTGGGSQLWYDGFEFKIGSYYFRAFGAYDSGYTIGSGTGFVGYDDSFGQVGTRFGVGSSATNVEIHWGASYASGTYAGSADITVYYQ